MKARLLQCLWVPFMGLVHWLPPFLILRNMLEPFDFQETLSVGLAGVVAVCGVILLELCCCALLNYIKGEDYFADLEPIWALPLWVDRQKGYWEIERNNREREKRREREMFLAEITDIERFLERNGVEIRIRQRDMEVR